MTAMTQKERSAKTAAKRAAAGERELRIRASWIAARPRWTMSRERA